MTDLSHRSVSFASYNRAAALDLIRRSGPLTRRELADALGLSRAGIATVVDQLVMSGAAVEEQGERTKGGPGRPPRLITLVEEGGASVLALIVRPRRVEAALVSSGGEVTASRSAEMPLSSDASASARELIALAKAVTAGVEPGPSAAALVLPTLVHDGGRIDHHGARELMPTWLDEDVVLSLERELGLSVDVVNETVAAAVGEAALAGTGVERCAIYVKVGASGTGMCTLVGGVPFGGASGIAGQLGHISIRGQGVRCPCGQRGCIAAEIDYQVREELERRRGHLTRFSVEDLVREAKDGEPATRRFFYDIGIQLAPALGAAINLLQPSTVVIGGDLADGDTGLLAGLEGELSLSVHPGIAEGLQVSVSRFGSISTAVGAASLIGDRARSQGPRMPVPLTPHPAGAPTATIVSPR